MGGLRTSEGADDVVGGEAKQLRSDDARVVDAPGRIIIDSGPTPSPAAAPRERFRTTGHLPIAPARAAGRGLVIVVYMFASAALAAAVYERFWM